MEDEELLVPAEAEDFDDEARDEALGTFEGTAQQRGNSREERIARLAPYQFKKGQSGNPAGRPAGKSLKEYAKEMLAGMTDEERQEYLQGIDKLKLWEMAEGTAKSNVDLTTNGKDLPTPLLANVLPTDNSAQKDSGA